MVDSSMAQMVASHFTTEQIAALAESRGLVVIDRADLQSHYNSMRAVNENGSPLDATVGLDAAVDFLFEALGEPGTEDQN